MDLDETDRRILALLQEDARRSFRDLAGLVGVSTPTVAAKVRALEALGVIQGYSARLDPRAFGRAGYVVEVETRPALAAGLAERLAAEPEVRAVTALAGGRLLVEAYTDGPVEALASRLAAMEEILACRYHPIVGARAGAPAEPPRSVDVACHECGGPVHGAGVRKRWDEEGRREHVFCCRSCAGAYETRLRRAAEGARRPARK
ncbi:MAG TPA: Lrp/AsnC family transcriptional regulator [Candidatus Thermoplasmatota archaeon]|nr:Lrp/AsnC family transcriptional regulator [Candidatus Thermoplasmatota archaeon]